MIPELAEANGFEWDAGNKEKVEKRMETLTAETAFSGEPMIFKDQGHSKTEPRWMLMNRVGQRHVFLVFTLRRDRIRILSARYMHQKEVKKYGKKIG